MKEKIILFITMILLGTSSLFSLHASGNEKWILLSTEEHKESSFLHSRKTKGRDNRSTSVKFSDFLVEQQEEKFEQGVSKFSQHRYDEAFNNFMEAAELGHPQAQYNLGLCYEFGVGVRASLKDAINGTHMLQLIKMKKLFKK